MKEHATENFPSELQDRLTNFDGSLSRVEDVLQRLHSIPLNEIHTKVKASIMSGHGMADLWGMGGFISCLRIVVIYKTRLFNS